MADNAPHTEPARPPHWVSIALIASLCLNFLFLGLFGAAIWQHHSAFRAPPPHGDRSRMEHNWPGRGVLSPRIMMDMVPGKADKIREILYARRDGLRPLRQNAMTARADVHTLMQGKDFSDAKLQGALEKVKTADAALEGYVLETLRQCYGQLSAEERQKMATASLQQIQDFQQQRHRMGPHGGSGPHGPRWQQRHGQMPGAQPE